VADPPLVAQYFARCEERDEAQAVLERLEQFGWSWPHMNWTDAQTIFGVPRLLALFRQHGKPKCPLESVDQYFRRVSQEEAES
jgi:hypothetical protein